MIPARRLLGPPSVQTPRRLASHKLGRAGALADDPMKTFMGSSV